ncbi:MAG: CCA tRNA nucleotidyltransferase, partial [Terrimicrobiaceae bacterium]|nr:CCA tRNA nucleotidyltransferase [Terrimicrobiaceae bacterium]
GHQALFAGGCVRDRLLGRPVKDVDIATDAEPARVIELFERTEAVGAHFGVVLVIEGGRPYEVATFRTDGPYKDGRHPESVAFTDARGDALRRDFTINGLFYDPLAGEVLDFVGGRRDLEARVLRAIGDPALRFREDHLRLLRAVRFAASLDFEIEESTWRMVCELAPLIEKVSPERIRDELVKILAAPARVRGLDLLEAGGLLRVLLPEVAALEGCEQPPDFHPEGDVYVHTRLVLGALPVEASPELALAALLHDIGKPPCASRDSDGRIRFNNHETVGARMAEDILRRLRCSNHQVEAICEMIRMHMAFKDTPNMRVSKLRRFMNRPTFPEELELHRADCLGCHADLGIYEFLRAKRAEFEAEPLVPPRLVTGQDLLDRGWKPGPVFREVLEAIQNLQLEGSLKSREEALAWLDREHPQPPTGDGRGRNS